MTNSEPRADQPEQPANVRANSVQRRTTGHLVTLATMAVYLAFWFVWPVETLIIGCVTLAGLFIFFWHAGKPPAHPQEQTMTNPTPEVELIARLRDDDTDPVMLRQAADLITALIEERAGQSHADAGLLAALEAATGYMLNAAIALEAGSNKRSAINTLNSGIERARAAIAAAKGADR